ncbi:MAG TPA: RNA polymerase sigma factor [Terriglobales bacterium]
MRAVENETDERQQVEAAQRDPSQFAELYESNFDRVYAFIARRVATREEAQDLTAEVFHQALAGLAHFEWRGTPFVAWLLGIAARVLAGYWERLGRRKEVSAEDLELAAAESPLERSTLIFRLVEALLPDQQLVIRRRFLEERSISEIAREMGRSEGAIKQLQLRAIRSLRAKMRSGHE